MVCSRAARLQKDTLRASDRADQQIFEAWWSNRGGGRCPRRRKPSQPFSHRNHRLAPQRRSSVASRRSARFTASFAWRTRLPMRKRSAPYGGRCAPSARGLGRRSALPRTSASDCSPHAQRLPPACATARRSRSVTTPSAGVASSSACASRTSRRRKTALR
jgi:hypothetical protein